MGTEMRSADDQAGLFHRRFIGTLGRKQLYVGMMALVGKSSYWQWPLISSSDGNRELNR